MLLSAYWKVSTGERDHSESADDNQLRVARGGEEITLSRTRLKRANAIHVVNNTARFIKKQQVT